MEKQVNFPKMKEIGCPACNNLGYQIDFKLSDRFKPYLQLCECALNFCTCEAIPPYYGIEENKTGGDLQPCAVLPLHIKIDRIKAIYQDSDLPRKYRYKFYNLHFRAEYINAENKMEFLKQINSVLPPVWEGSGADLSKGFFFTGVAGSGKTLLAAIIMNELIFRHAVSALFLKTTRTLDRIRATYNQSSATYGMSDLLEHWFSTVPVLVLDDFGAHQGTEWAEETLYDLIDTRYEEGLMTIITSNQSLTQLAEVAHGRIASRIQEMCHVIHFPNIDVRKTISMEK